MTQQTIDFICDLCILPYLTQIFDLMPGFRPPEGEADEPNYSSEQGMCLQATYADY
jgi:hypothetical protein